MVPYPNVFCELSRPPLPAATTTTMPAFQAASTAWLRGSVLYDCVIGRPKDRFITRRRSPPARWTRSHPPWWRRCAARPAADTRLPDHEGLVSPDIEQARIGRDGRRTELHRLQDGCTGRQFFAGLVEQTPWFARVPLDPPGERKSPERNPYKPNKTIGKLNNWLCSYKSTLAPFHPPLQTSG